jgi:hypothetical protein
MVEEPDSDSDFDLPLIQQSDVLASAARNTVVVDPSDNTDFNLDLALNEIQLSLAKILGMEKGRGDH